MKFATRIARGTAVFIAFGASCWAATLTGTVTNGTTGRPSSGDEVILIKLAAGMDELGHTKTDAQGKYSFSFDDASAPHLVRVVHQDVTYHQPAPPGSSNADVTVYDVSPKVDGVRGVADLMYIQAKQGQLGVTRIFAIENNSKPPRTQMNDANFQFYMPADAQIDAAEAQTAGGQGVNVEPAPQAEKGRYAFVFPLRPGQTQFQVTYHLPYGGKATIDPRLVYPLQHFVAILPKSISFTPATAGLYENRQPPDQPDGIAEIATNPQPSQKLAFDISGDGLLKSEEQDAANGGATPGGGLGAPIDAPDPLDKYRWYILAAVGAALVGGAVYTVNRSKASQPLPVAAGASGSSTKLLDGLKEELFQLELEHQQGQVSDDEYAKAKAALDQTLARAIKRSRGN